jgi:imidazolonepropionase-like amidohydrolase
MKFACAVLLALGVFLPVEPQPVSPLAITNVTIIDATGASAKPGMTVVIAGDRIAEIGRAGKVKLPKDAQVVDGRGKFLIPGLWDMHVHAWAANVFFPLFIANGITGVRDMFGPIGQVKHWRRQMAEGNLTGPRLYAAGQIVDGPKPIWPGSIAVSNEAEGRQAVARVKADGSDFVKVYSLLPRDAYFAIADEAKKQGLSFAGHVPTTVTAAESSDAGQKSIEHLDRVLLGCSTSEAEFVSQGARITSEMRRKMLESYSEEKARALFARFARNGTWQSPTLVVLRAISHMDDPKITGDPRLKYLPPFFTAQWDPTKDSRFRNYTPATYESLRATYRKNLELVGRMRRAGVEFLAGTDTPNPYCFPGFSLHDELQLLVEAGLTPMEALQAATRNPAKFTGQLDRLGTVEKGKLADLVLLDADPLVAIANTRKIHGVLLAGKWIDPTAIQAMLAQAEKAGRK